MPNPKKKKTTAILIWPDNITPLFILAILFTLATAGEIDDTRNYDLVDEEEPEIEKETEHLLPDINCLTQRHANFFGFPEKETTDFIDPKPLNIDVDPFMTFLDAKLRDKEIGDYLLNIDEVNEFFQIQEDEYIGLRLILDECAELPEKYELKLKEVNYFYCAVVWRHGFAVFTQHLEEQEIFKKGFFKIIDHTIGEIFDYKVYLHTLEITNYTLQSWKDFYKNLLEFNDVNVNHDSYLSDTKVLIKNTNFFFNKETFLDQNFFFRLYENYVDILRALNKAYFYFQIPGEPLLEKANELAKRFEKMMVDEVYESIFYMLMRQDEKFLQLLEDYFVHNASFTEIMEDELEGSAMDFTKYIEDIIATENSFNLADALADAPEEPDIVDVVAEPAANPLMNTEMTQYRVPEDGEDPRNLVVPTPEDIVQNVLDASGRHTRLREGNTKWAIDAPIMGPKIEEIKYDFGDVNHEARTEHGRILEEEAGEGGEGGDDGEDGGEDGDGEAEEDEEHFELPAQNDISKPAEFFQRIDFMKRPLDVASARMRLKDYFEMVEERVSKYYGIFANVALIEICNEFMETEIESFKNIFCLIMQKESSILLQQKFDNSKVRRFLDRYMSFISFNFFTFFKKLKDHGDLIEISVLTLFYGEKFFNAVKLAVVSLNNLALHFEGEYREYFEDRIREIFMPLINSFKHKIVHSFYHHEADIDSERLEGFDIPLEQMKEEYLTKFRPVFEERILKNVIDRLNLFDLEEQYKSYVNSMNLLSYDKIREKFEYFSKKDGIEISSEGPTSKCEEVHLKDMVAMSKRLKKVVDKQEEADGGEEGEEGGGDTEEEDQIEEGECAKQWKMYDDAFHYVFFNTDSSKIYIKGKAATHDPEEQVYQMAIASELQKVVNGFIAPRMKELLDHFEGDVRNDLEKCGIIFNYSRIKCFSIFGNENCDNVPGTFYFTRICPPGYVKFKGHLGCEFNCGASDLLESGEFCAKKDGLEDVTDCPPGTQTAVDGIRCFKPARRYFSYVFNPFNNAL